MAERKDAVLILTHRDDFYTVDLVAEELERRGARALRIDTDRFPTEVALGARLGPGGPDHVISTHSGPVRAREVRAVWARHVWPARFDEGALDPLFAEGCVRECVAAMDGFLDGLAAARWINPLDEDRAAGNKLRQLRLARACGLAVPRTLVTNDAELLRAFHAETEGRLVAKLLTRLTTSMEKTGFSVPTSEVRAEDLADGEQLRLCPMVFQERVEKDVELRAACVAGEIFVGAIDASRSAAGRVDWREADPREAPWQRGELPSDVAEGLRRLLAELGLVYGAVDLIRTPAGEHVFLEVNPDGEWGMLERDLGLPIAAALARALLEAPASVAPASRRSGARP